MSAVTKLKSLVTLITDEVTASIEPRVFRVFLRTVAPEVESFNPFTELLQHERLFKDKKAFRTFCEAVVWHHIITNLKEVLLADGDFDDQERQTVFQFVEPAVASLAAVDPAWEPFFPLTEMELAAALDFAHDSGDDNKSIFRLFTKDGGYKALHVALGVTTALKTGSLAIYNRLTEAVKLACKICASADGAICAAERDAFQQIVNRMGMATNIVAPCLENGLPETFATLLENDEKGIEAEKAPAAIVKSAEGTPTKVLEDALKELNDLIGLESVKSEVGRLANYLKVEAKRKEAGLPASGQALHFVFTGNPGTGKTTVGRIMAKLLYGYGVLSTSKLAETDRSNLVGGYIGQTAIKTKEVLDAALDGVLFIDEAYTLSKGGENDFGQEAIDTILKGMEDNRDRLVVMAAGYTNNMVSFLESNPGLKSRFTRFIDFPDYTPRDLCRIFLGMAEKNHYNVTPEALANLGLICHSLFKHRDKNFGNGRLVRNLFEKTLGNHADRIVDVENITKEVLTTITADDLPYDVAGLKKVAFPEEGDERWKAYCTSCETAHLAKLPMLGRRVKCKCGSSFRVPFWAIIDRNNRFASHLCDLPDDAVVATW